MHIDSSLARGLSKQDMRTWTEKSEGLRKEFIAILATAMSDFRSSRSPSKIVNRTLKTLRFFYGQQSVGGWIKEYHGRRFDLSLYLPRETAEGLSIEIIEAVINGRSGEVTIHEDDYMVLTLHLLQRLHQRLGSIESTAVLREIYSSAHYFHSFFTAAKNLGVGTWPLLGDNGLFVATVDSETATFVTWLPFDKMNGKWRRVSENLLKAKESCPELLSDAEFVRFFIQSFPWMLQPYKLGIDVEAEMWQDVPDEMDAEDAAVSSHAVLVEADENEAARSESANTQKGRGRANRRWISGLNYQDSHAFLRHRRKFSGRVIQIYQSGAALLHIAEGWYGLLPAASIRGAQEYGVQFPAVVLGDCLPVEIQRIRWIHSESAYLVELAISEVLDLLWKGIEVRFPVGTSIEGVVKQAGVYWCQLSCTSGVPALMLREEFQDEIRQDPEFTPIEIGKSLSLKIIGIHPEQRALLVTKVEEKMNGASEWPFRSGVVVSRQGKILVVHDSGGVSGVVLLHGLPDWIEFSVGDRVVVSSGKRNVNDSESKVEFKLLDLPKALMLYKSRVAQADQDSWESVKKRFPIGLDVEGVILYRSHKGNIVDLGNGVLAVLKDQDMFWADPSNELAYPFQMGCRISARVRLYRESRRIVLLSHRDRMGHPMDDPATCPKVGDVFLASVKKVADYGAFIRLPAGLIGLMHKSVIADDLNLEAGDQLNVQVIEVNRERHRIALKPFNKEINSTLSDEEK